MINQIWKIIKALFSGSNAVIQFIGTVAGLFAALKSLNFDVPSIFSSLISFLITLAWFVAGFFVGALLALSVFYIFRKYFLNVISPPITGPKVYEQTIKEGKKEKIPIKLWGRGSGAIFTCYDDLFAIAVRHTEYKKFVVIPVNTTFDTIVEDAGTQQQAPLVSPNTLHGMWIRNHGNYGLTLDDIQAQIEHSLHGEKVVRTISREQKPRGNCREYDIGTIAAVEGTHNTIFLLAALSAFDEKNRAHAGEDDIITVIKNIVLYCDTYGQQAPVYLPVIGTGLSRTQLPKEQAFRIILNALKSCENEVNEKYIIVIYPDDREDISIEGAAE